MTRIWIADGGCEGLFIDNLPPHSGYEVEVDDATLERWRQADAAYAAAQREMSDAIAGARLSWVD